MRWEETGVAWHPPSPNLRSIRAAELYPGFTWLEQTLVSAGRGTAAPFERYGFPYHSALKGRWMKDSIRGRPKPMTIKGLQAKATRFTPQSQPGKAAHPKYEGSVCWGFHIQSRPDSGSQVFLAGLEVLRNFHTEYIEHHKLKDQAISEPFFKPHFERLSGTSQLREAIKAGTPPEEIYAAWQQELRAFRRLRQQFLRYPR